MAAASGIVTGAVLDVLGPAIAICVSAAVMLCGSFVFGYGESYLAGYAMIAWGGMSVKLSANRAAYVYPHHKVCASGTPSPARATVCSEGCPLVVLTCTAS